MNQRNNIAGAVLLLVWIVSMFAFGSYMGIKADTSGDGAYEPAKGVGHPLYQDY